MFELSPRQRWDAASGSCKLSYSDQKVLSPVSSKNLHQNGTKTRLVDLVDLVARPIHFNVNTLNYAVCVRCVREKTGALGAMQWPQLDGSFSKSIQKQITLTGCETKCGQDFDSTRFYEFRMVSSEMKLILAYLSLLQTLLRSTLAWQGRCIFFNFVYYLQPTGRAKIFSIHQARGKLCESKWSETNEANEATQTLRVSFCHSFCLRPVLEHDMWRLRVVTSSKNHPDIWLSKAQSKAFASWAISLVGPRAWRRVTSCDIFASADVCGY